MEKVSIVGLDIAKNSLHAHGAAEDGSKVLSKALPRGRVLEFFGRVEPCIIALEACAGAHHWSLEFSRLGHDVRLIAPQYVKPYVKRQKNDANDGEPLLRHWSERQWRALSLRRHPDRPCITRQAHRNAILPKGGIGPVTAVSIAVLAAPPEMFSKGRDFAASCQRHACGVTIGLAPRQHSTAGRTRLGKISTFS